MQDLLLSKKQYFALLKRLDEINQEMSLLTVKPGPESICINNHDLLSLLHVSKRTAQRWRNSGRLPFTKIGRKLYYRTDTVLSIFSIRPGNLFEIDHPPP